MRPITEEQYRLCELLPKEPPAEMLRYAEQHRILHSHRIIYKGRPFTKKTAECTCTACGCSFIVDRYNGESQHCWNDFDILFGSDRLHSGMHTLCPLCGAEVTVIHTSRISAEGRNIDMETVAMAAVIGGHAAIISYVWRRTITKDGEVLDRVTPLEAYIFAGRRCYRFSGGFKNYYEVVYMDHFEPMAKCTDQLGKMDREWFMPVKKTAFDGTELENAKLDVYQRDSGNELYPVTYLRTYQQHRQVENLIVQGFSKWFNQLLHANAYRTYYFTTVKVPTEGINWKGRKPADLLGLTTEQFRAARAQKWTLDETELVRAANAHRIPFDVLAFRQANTMGHYEAKEALSRGMDPLRTYKYAKRQRKKDKISTYGTVLDYWRMLEKTGVGINRETAYPANLRREHDRLVELQQLQEIDRKAADAAQYNGAFRRLAARYAGFTFTDGRLTIRIAAAPRELFMEGLTLHHCVGSYVSSHAEGRRCIFFMRKAAEPDKPFFTLELNMETLEVIQNRGYKNCDRTKEVRAFEKAWLEFLASGAEKRKGA